MTRLAWLQTRTQTLVAAAAALVVAVIAAFTGVRLASQYADVVAACHGNGDCGLATSQFLQNDRFLQGALWIVVLAVPALVGVFWGAPLVARELESGTYRLAWTQSVTRSRWVLTKLGTGALASAALAGLVTLTVTWWFRAIDLANQNQYDMFDARNVAPMAYAVFAFALGAFVGSVVRRTVPAMAVTLAVFVAVRLATGTWLRPRLLPTVRGTSSLLSADRLGFLSNGSAGVTLVADGSAPANSWLLSNQIVDASGRAMSQAQLATWVQHSCPDVANQLRPGSDAAIPVSAFKACQSLAARTYHVAVTYQPANHYWGIQALEAGFFLLLALLAAAGCYGVVTRRTS